MRQGIDDVNKRLGTLGNAASKAGTLVKGMVAGFAIAGIARATRAFAELGDEYTKSLAQVNALTDAQTRGGMTMNDVAAGLSKQAPLFAKYGNNIGDAANGLVELVKAGQTLPNAMKEVASTMTLAAAGELSVADAANIVSNTLNTFKLRGSQAAFVANALANGANASSADVGDLAYSLKYVAPIAHTAGINLQTTVAALAELSNAGLNGTVAGTGLRKVINSLATPTAAGDKALKSLGVTIFDTSGKMKALPVILDQLHDKMNGLSQAKKLDLIKSIFGVIGAPAAITLIDKGGKGLGEMTKQVTRAGAANKLAAANTNTLLGTFRTLRADVESSAQALYQKYSPAVNKAIKPAVEWLVKNQSAIGTTAKEYAEKLIPALQDVVTIGEKVYAAFASQSGLFKTVVVPALENGAKAAKSLLDAVAAIPAPVIKLGLEVTLAAVAFAKLEKVMLTARAWGSVVTGGVGSSRIALKGMASDLGILATTWMTAGANSERETARMQAATERLKANFKGLGEAARQAAGIGGMVLLTKGLQDVNNASHQTAGTIETTLGGALAGFATAGFWGALVGGSGGLLYSLTRDTTKAQLAAAKMQDQMSQSAWAQQAKQDNQTVRQSLNQLTGAYTADTRAAVLNMLQHNHLISAANTLGISTHDLISAVLGNKHAQDEVSKATNAHTEAVLRNTKLTKDNGKQIIGQLGAMDKLRAFLPGVTNDVKRQTKAQQDQAIATQGLRKVLGLAVDQYHKIPKQITSDLTLHGLPQGKKQLEDFVHKYGGKSFATATAIAKIEGLNVTEAQLKKWAADAKGIGQTGGKNFGDGTASGISGSSAKVNGAAGDLISHVSDGGAYGKGHSIGGYLGQGMAEGIHSQIAQVAAQAAALVRGAEEAARAQGQVHSPSRVFRVIGQFLSQGLQLGIKDGKPGVTQAMNDLMSNLISASDKQFKKLHDKLKAKVLDKDIAGINKRIHDFFNSKVENNLEKKMDATAKSLVKVNNALASAQQKLAAAKQAWTEYYQSAKGNAIDFASITNTDSAFTGPALIQAQDAKLAQLKQFESYLATLRKWHLNKTTYDQILQAGPDQGFAYAQALVKGGIKDVNQYNAVQAQINKQSDNLAKQSANYMKNAGIAAAQGLVNGLKAKQSAVEKAATNLGLAMARAIKKALGIKSPSTVFRQIGLFTQAGLTNGLGDRSGLRRIAAASASMSNAVVNGYATPAIAAPAASNGARPVVVQITVKADATTDTKKLGKALHDSINEYLGESQGRRLATA